MNKQELIKKYVYMKRNLEMWLSIPDILEDLKQLDEPQKVKVPQFVADWYEEHKDDFETSLFCSIDLIPSCYEEGELSDFEEWLVDEHTKPFQTLVNMHQFGYTVEKEKRYLVKMKGVKEDYNFLNLIRDKNVWVLSSLKEDRLFRTAHTRKELEDAGFGWVFDCPGMEVEEVEG